MADKPTLEEIIKVMDWFSSKNLNFEDQLAEMSEVERGQLYDHDLCEEFDLLPQRLTKMAEIRDKIDIVLRDYGVDWKFDDSEYYEALKDELIIVIERVFMR